MSRHVLVDFDHCRIVLGFDQPLRSFFGQAFEPRRDPETAIDGWPTSSGLGTRRPVVTAGQADEDVAALSLWAMQYRQLPASLWLGTAWHRLKGLQRCLIDEWRAGEDLFSLPPPPALTGPFHPIPLGRP